MQRIKLAVEVETLARHESAHDVHHFERAAITRRRIENFARHFGRDDVHGESTVERLMQCGELTRKLRRPHFATTHCYEQFDVAGDGSNRRCERNRVDAEGIPRRKENVVEPALFSFKHDVAAMIPTTAQVFAHNAELFVVVVAQRTEPRDFGGWQLLRHGKGTPSLATTMRYTSSRFSCTLTARESSCKRSMRCVPMIATALTG